MLTQKGSKLDDLLDIEAYDNTLSVYFRNVPVCNVGSDEISVILTDLKKLISEEKRGYLTVGKLIAQIELHKEHLRDAIVKLVEFHSDMSTPKTRAGSTVKARLDMLQGMPDKVLREYGKAMIGDSALEFILPGDRDKLTNALLVELAKN